MQPRTAKIVSFMTTWILRLLVVMTILFFGAVILTATLGGNGDMQRRSLETVIKQLTGFETQVFTLHDYRLFPNYVIDAEQIVMRSDDQDEPAAVIGRVQMVQDSLARMWGSPPIEQLKLDHILTRPGVLGPFSLHIKSVTIETAETGRAVLVATGRYGGHPWEARLPMLEENDKTQIDGLAPLQMTWGPLTVAGRLSLSSRAAVIEDMVLDGPAGVKLRGTLAIPKGENGTVGLPILEVTTPSGIMTRWRIDEWQDAVILKGLSSDIPVPVVVSDIAREVQRLIRTAERVDGQGKPLPRVKVEVR